MARASLLHAALDKAADALSRRLTTRFIVTAASHAQRASDYLRGLQDVSAAAPIEHEAAAA